MNTFSPSPYYAADWRNHQATLSQGGLTVWFDRDMQWFAPLTGKSGRNPTFSDASIKFCLTVRELFGLPLRQTIVFVQKLLQLSGLDWSTPDYSTLCRRQKQIGFALPCTPRDGGLHLLIDSTGTRILGEGEWKHKKYGAYYRRHWCKIQLGMDAGILKVCMMEPKENTGAFALPVPMPRQLHAPSASC